MKTLLTMLFVAVLAPAQALDINLDALGAKAKDKAEITLEGALLTQALQMAPAKVKDSAKISRILLRHYEFEKSGQYSDADLESVRKQVSNNSWSRILNVKEEGESTEIYMSMGSDGKPAALLPITAEAKELTMVHVVGSIDLASLKEVVNSTIHYDLKSTEGQ
jgi:hypothetical protein